MTHYNISTILLTVLCVETYDDVAAAALRQYSAVVKNQQGLNRQGFTLGSLGSNFVFAAKLVCWHLVG